MTTGEQEYDYLFKLLLIGNSSVDKSSLLFLFMENVRDDSFVPIIEVEFKRSKNSNISLILPTCSVLKLNKDYSSEGQLLNILLIFMFLFDLVKLNITFFNFYIEKMFFANKLFLLLLIEKNLLLLDNHFL